MRPLFHLITVQHISNVRATDYVGMDEIPLSDRWGLKLLATIERYFMQALKAPHDRLM